MAEGSGTIVGSGTAIPAVKQRVHIRDGEVVVVVKESGK